MIEQVAEETLQHWLHLHRLLASMVAGVEPWSAPLQEAIILWTQSWEQYTTIW